jgi:hypothetical protein
LIKNKLVSTNIAVATLDTFGVVRGQAPGLAVIAATVANRVVGSVEVSILDEFTAISGLDIASFSEVQAWLVEPATDSLSKVDVAVSLERGALTYEGAISSIVVSAVFDDGQRMQLSQDDGILLKSLQPDSLRVNGTLAFVPFMAKPFYGKMIEVVWSSPGEATCLQPLESGTAILNVSLPMALSATISIVGTDARSQPPMIVHSGGAAELAGLPISARIQVTLEYRDRVADVTSDPRTIFDLSAANGLFEIDKQLGVLRGAPGNHVGVGLGTIVVRFEHEDVTGECVLQLADFDDLIVLATPYPQYDGSAEQEIDTLSPVFGSEPVVFESASLTASMLLTNNVRISLPAQGVEYLLTDDLKKRTTHVSVDSNGVLVPHDTGVVQIRCSIHGVVSKHPKIMRIWNDPVFVKSIDDVRVTQQGQLLTDELALRSDQYYGHGYVDVSITLTNGRRYVSLFKSSGVPVLSGLVRFEADSSDAFLLDSTTGKVTLKSNYHKPVSIIASMPGPYDKALNSSTAFHCNLDSTAIGDVDIGNTVREPLQPRKVGDTFSINVHVNSGSMKVGAFDMYIYFDPTILSVVEPKNAVAFLKNKMRTISGILDAVLEPGVLHFSGNIDQFNPSGRTAPLVSITFDAIAGGTSPINGLVELLGSASLPSIDIGERNSLFKAGDVFQTVTGGRTRRSYSSQDSMHLALNRRILAARRPRNVIECEQETGDTNADCLFDVNDVRFVTQYLAYRGIDFKGEDGPIVKQLSESSTHSQAALDSDHSGEINGKDASFLNKVNLGIFAFTEDLNIVTQDCTTQITVTLLSKGDHLVSLERTKLFFYVAHQGDDDIGLNHLTIGKNLQTLEGGLGTIVEPRCSEEATNGKQATQCRVSFNAESKLSEDIIIGTSIVQITRLSTSIESKFMAGGEKAPFRFVNPFHATLSIFGEEITVKSSDAGYNPQMESSLRNEGCSLSSSPISTTTTSQRWKSTGTVFDCVDLPTCSDFTLPGMCGFDTVSTNCPILCGLCKPLSTTVSQSVLSTAITSVSATLSENSVTKTQPIATVERNPATKTSKTTLTIAKSTAPEVTTSVSNAIDTVITPSASATRSSTATTEASPLSTRTSIPCPAGLDGFIRTTNLRGVQDENDIIFFDGLTQDECARRCSMLSGATSTQQRESDEWFIALAVELEQVGKDTTACGSFTFKNKVGKERCLLHEPGQATEVDSKFSFFSKRVECDSFVTQTPVTETNCSAGAKAYNAVIGFRAVPSEVYLAKVTGFTRINECALACTDDTKCTIFTWKENGNGGGTCRLYPDGVKTEANSNFMLFSRLSICSPITMPPAGLEACSSGSDGYTKRKNRGAKSSAVNIAKFKDLPDVNDCALECTADAVCEIFTWKKKGNSGGTCKLYANGVATESNSKLNMFTRLSRCAGDVIPGGSESVCSYGIDGYSKEKNLRAAESEIPLEFMLGISADDCALLCSGMVACKVFAYNKESTLCNLHEMGVSIEVHKKFSLHKMLPNCDLGITATMPTVSIPFGSSGSTVAVDGTGCLDGIESYTMTPGMRGSLSDTNSPRIAKVFVSTDVCASLCTRDVACGFFSFNGNACSLFPEDVNTEPHHKYSAFVRSTECKVTATAKPTSSTKRTAAPNQSTQAPEIIFDTETKLCTSNADAFLETWIVSAKEVCPDAAIDHFTISNPQSQSQTKLSYDIHVALCACSEKCLGRSDCNEFHLLPFTGECLFESRGEIVVTASFVRNKFCDRSEALALVSLTSNQGSIDIETFARIGDDRTDLQMNVAVICGGKYCGSGILAQSAGVNWNPQTTVTYMKPSIEASSYVVRVSIVSAKKKQPPSHICRC